MSALQHWLVLTFARLLHALTLAEWAIVLGVGLLAGIGAGVFVFLWLRAKAMEASD